MSKQPVTLFSVFFPCGVGAGGLALTAMLLLIQPYDAAGHDDPEEKEVRFSCPVAEVAGVLTFPHDDDEVATAAGKRSAAATTKFSCVVIVGGTMSHTRDGGMVREGAPPRTALKRLARALAEKGYASLRFDRVGYGGSKPAGKWTGSYQDEAAVAAAAIAFVRKRADIGFVAVAGESAGAYLACLAAKEGTSADTYVFLGAHCGPGEAIYEYNYGPLVKDAERSPEQRAWAEKELPLELALGTSYQAIYAAAAKGDEKFEVVNGSFRKTIDLKRQREELQMPPDEMFQHIQAPALGVSGGKDLNVPAEHAGRAVSMMRRAGNHATTCVTIPGADHSFQIAAADEATRFRERYSFESFRREYDPRLDKEVIAWLDQQVAKQAAPSTAVKRKGIPDAFTKRGSAASEKVSRTEISPARLYLSPGVQIIEDITDRDQTAGVETLEGRIGPLLLAEEGQAHFIDMPAGMFCEEHPHSTESIIYTVRGKWVLCSHGRRQVMKPGTLFHFAVNTPTGYEVPFGEDAMILIFKGKRTTEKEEDFIKYLEGFSERLKKEQQAGIPYLMKDLPRDHAALRFAAEVIPGYASGGSK